MRPPGAMIVVGLLPVPLENASTEVRSATFESALIINSEDEPILPLIPNSRFLFYKNMQQHAVGEDNRASDLTARLKVWSHFAFRVIRLQQRSLTHVLQRVLVFYPAGCPGSRLCPHEHPRGSIPVAAKKHNQKLGR